MRLPLWSPHSFSSPVLAFQYPNQSRSIHWAVEDEVLSYISYGPYKRHMTPAARRIRNASAFVHKSYYSWKHVHFMSLLVCVDHLTLTFQSLLCSSPAFCHKFDIATKRNKKQLLSVVRDDFFHPPTHCCSDRDQEIAMQSNLQLGIDDQTLADKSAMIRNLIRDLF